MYFARGAGRKEEAADTRTGPSVGGPMEESNKEKGELVGG